MLVESEEEMGGFQDSFDSEVAPNLQEGSKPVAVSVFKKLPRRIIGESFPWRVSCCRVF